MTVIEIVKFVAGATTWYNYEPIPQTGYIKYNCMATKNDKEALKLAKRLNANFEYKIVGDIK